MSPMFSLSNAISLQMFCSGQTHYREKCKRLELYGTHDADTQDSHANHDSKQLIYNQIVAVHDAVVIAPNQSATKLRGNLVQAKGSPEQHKHMDFAQLCLIQRRVKATESIWTSNSLALMLFPNHLVTLLCGAWRKISMTHCASTIIRTMSIAHVEFETSTPGPLY